MTRRMYEELFGSTTRLTEGTRTRLERAIGRALFGYKGGLVPLKSAVRSATHELRAFGLADAAILGILGAVVEDAGRACRADRTSLVSGNPHWMALRVRVVSLAQNELAASIT